MEGLGWCCSGSSRGVPPLIHSSPKKGTSSKLARKDQSHVHLSTFVVKSMASQKPIPSATKTVSSAKDKVKCSTRRSQGRGAWSTKCSSCSFIGVNIPPAIELSASDATVVSVPYSAHEVAQFLKVDVPEMSQAVSELIKRLVLVDLDPATAKLAISFLGPFLSAFGFLFILRIVMSWYPKLPVEKFPYVIAYAPTEPLLFPTRKLIPPLGGVDVTPVVWFGLISFLNEILVGPQGLLVLLSQQV